MNRIIVNKDDELIKEYLDVRSRLIIACENTEYFESICKSILYKGEYDFLCIYDEEIISKKLTPEAYELFGLMMLVEHDYIAYDDNSYSPDLKSFKTSEERNEWYDSDNNSEYFLVDLEEREGSLNDNLSLIENYEDGDALFLKESTIYSDKIKIGILKY